MNTKLKTSVKVLMFCAVIAGISTAGFSIKETGAAISAPSGKCGLSGYSNMAGMNTRVSNWESVTTMTNGVVDFDINKVSYTDTVVAGYGSANAQTSSDVGQTAFTLAQTSQAGMYQLTFSSGHKLNVVSTNSGNTLLMQSVATSDDNGPVFVAVCQAL